MKVTKHDIHRRYGYVQTKIQNSNNNKILKQLHNIKAKLNSA